MTQIYEYIFNYLSLNNRLKIIKLSDYFGYLIITNKKLWFNIEIYNLKGYKYILEFIKKINNEPKTLICMSSSKLNINLKEFNLKKLNHFDISNSKMKFDNFLHLLYSSKLKKLYLKRVDFYNIMRHIASTQKDTLEELDLSISQKCTSAFGSYNINRINKLQNLKVLKINNNNISYQIFKDILNLPKLETLEIINCFIGRADQNCFCNNIQYLIDLLEKLKDVKVDSRFFCKNTNEILKLKLKNILIL